MLLHCSRGVIEKICCMMTLPNSPINDRFAWSWNIFNNETFFIIKPETCHCLIRLISKQSEKLRKSLILVPKWNKRRKGPYITFITIPYSSLDSYILLSKADIFPFRPLQGKKKHFLSCRLSFLWLEILCKPFHLVVTFSYPAVPVLTSCAQRVFFSAGWDGLLCPCLRGKVIARMGHTDLVRRLLIKNIDIFSCVKTLELNINCSLNS